MIYSFEDRFPQFLGENYFIAPSADVIGSVIIGNNVSILFHAVVRADNDTIEIGDGTNIQDGAVLHTDADIPMKIGENVTIAHHATLHGCMVGDNSVIAMNAVVMNNTIIGKNCMIGANALVLENQIIPDNSLVLGSPGQVKKQLSAEQVEQMLWFSKHYIEKIKRLNERLKVLSPDFIS